MSGLLDLLRDRARLALRGAAEEGVVIGTWKRTARAYADAFDGVLGLVNRAEFRAVEFKMLRGLSAEPAVLVEVAIDAEAFVALLERTHGREHPTTVLVRSRVEAAKNGVQSPS